MFDYELTLGMASIRKSVRRGSEWEGYWGGQFSPRMLAAA